MVCFNLKVVGVSVVGIREIICEGCTQGRVLGMVSLVGEPDEILTGRGKCRVGVGYEMRVTEEGRGLSMLASVVLKW